MKIFIHSIFVRPEFRLLARVRSGHRISGQRCLIFRRNKTPV
jgi:hypothetical protein